jgi:hypothetical protein
MRSVLAERALPARYTRPRFQCPSWQRPARRNAQRVGRASSLGVGAARLARVARPCKIAFASIWPPISFTMNRILLLTNQEEPPVRPGGASTFTEPARESPLDAREAAEAARTVDVADRALRTQIAVASEKRSSNALDQSQLLFQRLRG